MNHVDGYRANNFTNFCGKKTDIDLHFTYLPTLKIASHQIFSTKNQWTSDSNHVMKRCDPNMG